MKNDQVFTPDYIVKKMLDDIDYRGDNLRKTIFEPSFGDGAFLVEIVTRILDYAQNETEAHELLDLVMGCEIDPVMHNRALERLDGLVTAKGYGKHNWYLLENADLLRMRPGHCQYIVGNPPYVRIHDLDKNTRDLITDEYPWCTGMTDLYVVFFEECIRRMAPGGELIFITPNSWMRNSSQKKMREYLQENSLVHRITDYHALPVFGPVLTYPAITHLKMDFSPTWEFVYMATLSEEAWRRTLGNHSGFQNIVPEETEQYLLNLTGPTLGELCTVQNGISTNCDRVYIKPWAPRGEYLRPVIKASTLNMDKSIIFPYEWTGTGYTPLSEERFKELEPDLYYSLYFNKDQLEARNMERHAQWFQYARSQGIQNSRHRKFVLKHILAPEQRIAQFEEVGPEVLVYSGMYIIVNDEANIERVREVLSSRAFCEYLKLMGKDMAGGYKTVNTKIVKAFPMGVMMEDRNEG